MIILEQMDESILIEDLSQFNQIALIIEKNFYEEGKFEVLFSYEKRPSIKDFRTNEKIRNEYFDNIIHILKDEYPFTVSSRYQRILEIKKSPNVVGIINLNIDGILTLNNPQNVIDLEGNINWVYCSTCGMDKSMESVVKNQDDITCISCRSNILKPSMPFKGQDIAQWDLRDSWMLLNKCDNLTILVADQISPMTYSFIEIVRKRNKEIYIVDQSGEKYENMHSNMINLNFINYSIDNFLHIMIESLNNKII